MSIANKLIKKLDIQKKKEIESLKVPKREEKLNNLVVEAEKSFFKKFFLKDFEKIANYLIKEYPIKDKYKLVINFDRDLYQIDDEWVNNHRITASVSFNEKNKVTKSSDIKKLKEKLKEKKNFKICISNNANWEHMDYKLFALDESEKALNYLDEMFSQDIDGYMIGPYDLSSSMGIAGDFTNVDFINAEESILNAAKKYDIKRGYHIVEPDLEQLELRKSQGYNFIAFSVDFRMLDVMARTPFSND